jgi:hypothetical protein
MAARRAPSGRTRGGSSGGDGGNPGGLLTLTRDKAKATTKPVSRLSQLKGVWDREFGVYRVLIVEVLARRRSSLTFRFFGNAPRWNPPGEYTVNLDDGHVVWGDLPSTAQLVDLESSPRVRIGYLLLAENWLRENLHVEVPAVVEPPSVRAPAAAVVSRNGNAPGGDPPKVPWSCSL